MTDTSEIDRENTGARGQDMTAREEKLHAWFVREVLPLEAALTNYLRHNWRNQADISDLVQDIYVRVYDAARKTVPDSPRAFVFATAHNLLVNRLRREQIVPIQAIEDLEALGVAADVPGPDEHAMAREELRRVQAALDHLPPRAREAVVLYQVHGLSRQEIAVRMAISEKTVTSHLNAGMRALADLLYGGAGPGRINP
jgi:RNA polymerase sigma-70 factor (ECF subfamily)